MTAIAPSATGSPTAQAGLRAALPVAAPLLLGYGALQAGNALQGSLLAVRAEAIGFSASEVGLVAAGFWVGMIAGSLRVPPVIAAVGQVRTFAALASLASAAALLHLLIQSPAAWVAIRALTGVCFAGLFICVESWLNGAATQGTRGRLLAVYGMTGLLAGVAGQFLLPLADASGYVLFCLVSVIISCSLVPVALTRVSAPTAPEALGGGRLGWRDLAGRTPFGVIAAPLAGVSAGAFFGLGPFFAVRAGMSVLEVAGFMATASFGAFAATWPLGRLSDRIDRRLVVTACSSLATALLLALAAVVIEPVGVPRGVQFAFALGFGALIVPTYGIVAAHVNDRMGAHEHVHASGRLLILYGAGSAFGPVAAGLAISTVGDRGFSLVILVAQAAIVASGVWRIVAEGTLPRWAKRRFAPTPVTPAIAPGPRRREPA